MHGDGITCGRAFWWSLVSFVVFPLVLLIGFEIGGLV